MLGTDHRTEDFYHTDDCPCCKRSKTIQPWEMAGLAFDMALKRKADGSGERGGDQFLEFELVIASVLFSRAEAFMDRAEEIMQKPFYIPKTEDDGHTDFLTQKASTKNWAKYTARLEEVIAAAEEAITEWGNIPLTVKQENNIKWALEDSVAAGVGTTALTVTEAELAATARTRIVEGMWKATKYYSNEFFNTQVFPALVKAVQEAVAKPGDALIYPVIRDVLAKRLKTVPYWRVVANAAASRSYHYGMIKSAESAGRRAYQFLAIVDERTSDICKAMNGKTWPIADAVQLVERIADADPDSVKDIAPWRKLEEVEPYLNDQRKMVELGVLLPPLHGNCRSTIVIV